MGSCSVNLRSTGSPHGDHANLQLQQPMDGPFSVGSGRVPQQPPYNGAPDQHQVRGFLSAGSGHFGAKPSSIHLPGTALQHSGAAESPSQLSSGEMMIRFSQLMEQLLKQQLQLQPALSAMQSAMAAAPSSSIIQPVPEPQQHIEVMPSTRCDQGPCHLCQSSEPHSSVTSSISTSQQTVGQASPKRAPAASEDGQRPAGETISDVTSDDHHRRIIVDFPKQDGADSFGQRFQPMPANPFNCQITQAPASTTAKNSTSVDVIGQPRGQHVIRPASYAAYGAAKQQLSRQKQVNIILDVYSSWPSSAKRGQAGASKISSGLMDLAECHHQYPSSTSKVAAKANGSRVLFIVRRGPRPDQGKVVKSIDYLPPWPPPTFAFCSPTQTVSKIRGGREDVQSISNATKSQKVCPEKSMSGNVRSLTIQQQKRAEPIVWHH
uniref:(northern house mosquito) hypothetical protein n=1 Tax=Culex pipiens TaxID=7175 RepID=A0A8D8DSH8_CULPI